MGTVVYTMNVSLDGYIEDRDGDAGFSEPDDAVHLAANEQAQAAAAFLFGRRIYEVMEGFWPTAEATQELTPTEAAFARIYVATPRVVFSDTLTEVADGVRLVRREHAFAEVARLKAEVDGELAVGGADLAASLVELIDEFRLFVVPVAVGGGKPYFPAVPDHLPLRLIEHRPYDSGTVYLRYARAT